MPPSAIARFGFAPEPVTWPVAAATTPMKAKLLDAFTLLNSFVGYINEEKKKPFQIIMVEHASKEYWIDNNLSYFHTVDEFIDGKGLIPNEIYNN